LLFRRYDLIYTHMLSSFQTITTFFIGHIIRRKPFVVMTEHWHLRKSRTVNWWYRTVSRSARLVVAQSTRSRRFFVEVLGVPHERVVTCVNTVGDLDALPYAEEIEAELRGRATFKVLCVARFKEVKGQDNLISAFRQIDGDDIELILVGEHATDFGQECVKIASGDDRIRFQGAAPFESVLAFYRACDLFVLPNRFTKDPLEGAESFGYAALEAAYLGLPIILSGATGCAEDLVIEGVTGRQVAEGSPEALRAALTELFAAPDQVKRMGVAAKEHARGLCSDATIEGFASALEDILDELGRQPSVPAS
jgi:glycosyltransferase involved in cell wall biosynthesis